MNKFLRVLFILVILAMTGAIIFQLFFPTYMEVIRNGISVGWQGDWYLECGGSGHPPAVNLRTIGFIESCSIALILGGLGIGTNHFLSYLQYHHSVNAIWSF